jgi:hypothetical protein
MERNNPTRVIKFHKHLDVKKTQLPTFASINAHGSAAGLPISCAWNTNEGFKMCFIKLD